MGKLLAIALLTAAGITDSSAQNYPWCGHYASHGSINCGFTTLEQCRAALSGNGGSCIPNASYSAAGQGGRKPRRR